MPAHEGDYALPAFQRRLLLGVAGTLQREGEGEHGVAHLIAKRLFDHSDLLGRLLTASRGSYCAPVKGSSRLDSCSRHRGESRGPVRLSCGLHGYQRHALDSGLRRNECACEGAITAW